MLVQRTSRRELACGTVSKVATDARSFVMGQLSSQAGVPASDSDLLSYYEWLAKGKDKLPHLTRHKSGNRLMLMAGLYDSVVLEGIRVSNAFGLLTHEN